MDSTQMPTKMQLSMWNLKNQDELAVTKMTRVRD